jgi:hypothetical protein
MHWGAVRAAVGKSGYCLMSSSQGLLGPSRYGQQFFLSLQAFTKDISGLLRYMSIYRWLESLNDAFQYFANCKDEGIVDQLKQVKWHGYSCSVFLRHATCTLSACELLACRPSS